MEFCQAPGCRRRIPANRSALAKYCSQSCKLKRNVYATRRRRQAAGLRVDQPLKSLRKDPVG